MANGWVGSQAQHQGPWASCLVSRHKLKILWHFEIFVNTAYAYMRQEISKRYFSYSFHQMSIKVNQGIGYHGGIQAISFLGNRLSFFQNFVALRILTWDSMGKSQNGQYLENGRDSSQEYAWISGSKSVVYFQARCRFNFFLTYGSMLMKRTKMAKMWNFANLYTTLVEAFARSMHEFLEWICYLLSEEMSFEFFLPYCSMLTKTKKIVNH